MDPNEEANTEVENELPQDDIDQDEEGMNNMTNIGESMAYLLNKLNA